MRDLTEFEKGKNVGARMAEASVTKTVELLSFSRATISWTMTEFKKPEKTSDRDRRLLKRIAGRKHRTTAAKVTDELNQHLNSSVSTKTVRCEFNKIGCQ